MEILVASSSNKTESQMVLEVTEKFQQSLQEPKFLLVLFSKDLDAELLRENFVNMFPNAVITGVIANDGSFDNEICLGLEEKNLSKVVVSSATNESAVSRFSVNKFKQKNVEQESVNYYKGIIVQAFFDNSSSFGNVITSYLPPDLKLADSIKEASDMAGFRGVMPDLVFLYHSVSATKFIAQDLATIYGNSLPIIGGVLGKEDDRVVVGFTQDKVIVDSNFYIITLMYSTVDIVVERHCPILDTYNSLGAITKIQGNCIEEINNQPAADLFLKSINVHSIDMSYEELDAYIKSINEEMFVGKQVSSLEFDEQLMVSYISGVTKDRGLVINCFWGIGEVVYPVKLGKSMFASTFMHSDVPITKKVIASYYIMCKSYRDVYKDQGFTKDVLEKVRDYNKEIPYMVHSVGGEYGKNVDNNIEIHNATVATVSFLDKD
ncbi:MAG: hypothetical protein ACI4V7_07150 [Succinivibrionaceae bacterium]